MPPVQRSNATTRPQTAEGHQGQLLRYDVRPKLSASQRPRGFHKVKDLLPHSALPEASNIHRLRPPQPSGTCPSTITQSTSQAVVTGAVACSDPGLGTLENHYWRAFNMNTFTGGQAYDVTSVEFGIEQAESLFGTDQPLTVNLYVNHGSPFPDGDWQSNLVGSSGEIRVPNQELTIFNVPLTTTVPAGTLELVMEVLSPDQTAEHNFFIIGSNPDPETGPSYLSAPDCGNPDPVATRCIGFPDMHYVFNVNGSCAGGGGTPTPTPTATPPCPPTVIAGSIDTNDPTQMIASTAVSFRVAAAPPTRVRSLATVSYIITMSIHLQTRPAPLNASQSVSILTARAAISSLRLRTWERLIQITSAPTG